MPSNTVVEVYNDLISPSHKVTRGSIGIQFQPEPLGRGQSRLRLQERRAGAAGAAGRPGGKGRPRSRATSSPPSMAGHQGRRRSGERDCQPQARLDAFAWATCATASQADTTVTIGDRDKVFAELGSQQAERRLRRARAMPARPSWASWSASVSRSHAAKLHSSGRGRFSRSAPARSPTCRDWSPAWSSSASTSSPPPPRSSSTPW